MSDTIRVVSMAVYPAPRPAGQNFALAELHVEIGPLLLTGCTLARVARGGLRVWLPSGNRNQRVILRALDDYERLTLAAVEEYRAQTGHDLAASPVATAPEKDAYSGPAYDLT